MRFVSLLVTLLILAWVILQQLGSSSGTKTTDNTAKQAEAKAQAVQAQVNQVYQAQTAAVSREESGESPDSQQQ